MRNPFDIHNNLSFRSCSLTKKPPISKPREQVSDRLTSRWGVTFRCTCLWYWRLAVPLVRISKSNRGYAPYFIHNKMQTLKRPSFIECYRLFFQNAFVFNTRSRRAEFAYVMLGNTLIFVGFFLIDIWGEKALNNYWQEYSDITAYLFFGMIAILLVPWFSLICRRMHDANRSALNLLWFLLPWVGLLCYFGLLIALSIKDSHKEDNKWGKSPKYLDEYEKEQL